MGYDAVHYQLRGAVVRDGVAALAVADSVLTRAPAISAQFAAPSRRHGEGPP